MDEERFYTLYVKESSKWIYTCYGEWVYIGRPMGGQQLLLFEVN